MEELCGPEEILKEFKRVLIEKFDKHFIPGLFLPAYHLLGHVLVYIQIIKALLVLDCRPYVQFDEHVEQTYVLTSLRIQTATVEFANVV